MIYKNIVIASDHAGFELKEKVKKYLDGKIENIVDLGTNSLESVDYPDYARKVADFMLENKEYMGILLCGTGIGISIAANRFKHVRAALCHDETVCRLSRKHNGSNVLVLGGRTTGSLTAYAIVDVFLNTEFEGGRHARRIELMS